MVVRSGSVSVSTQRNGVEASAGGYFAYKPGSAEYRVDPRHEAAPHLARIILAGAADYDRLPDDVVRRRIGGALVPILANMEAAPTLAGVSTDSPTRLHTSLDAFIRMPDITISDRELAHLARADFEAFWLRVSGEAATSAA